MKWTQNRKFPDDTSIRANNGWYFKNGQMSPKLAPWAFILDGTVQMLSRENNDLLTRVGPATDTGQVLRQYWMPAILSEEISSGRGIVDGASVATPVDMVAGNGMSDMAEMDADLVNTSRFQCQFEEREPVIAFKEMIVSDRMTTTSP